MGTDRNILPAIQLTTCYPTCIPNQSMLWLLSTTEFISIFVCLQLNLVSGKWNWNLKSITLWWINQLANFQVQNYCKEIENSKFLNLLQNLMFRFRNPILFSNSDRFQIQQTGPKCQRQRAILKLPIKELEPNQHSNYSQIFHKIFPNCKHMKIVGWMYKCNVYSYVYL